MSRQPRTEAGRALRRWALNETASADSGAWSDRLDDLILAIEDEAVSPVPAPTLDVERQAAAALLNWFDTTHGNEFGHDHHCPVPYTPNPHTADPDDRCTCGWSDFIRADTARFEAVKAATPSETGTVTE